VIPELSSLMQDENADVRFAVAQALGDIGTESVVPVLAKALQDKDENVRVSAADAFLRIGAVAKPAKPVLISALWDGNWYVRSRVAKTISKLGLEESDIPKLMEPWKDGTDPDTGAIVSVMIAIDPHVRQQVRDIPVLFIKALQNPNPKIRESAATALGEIVKTRPGKARLVETTNALIKASQDKNTQVRLESYRALKSVINYLNRSFSDSDPDIKIDKSQLFTKIELALILGIQDSEPMVRVSSIDAIRELNNINHSSLSIIISSSLKLLQDQNPSVRRSAVSFLGRLRFGYLNTDSRTLTSQIDFSEKTEFLKIVTPAIKKALYDQDEGVRLAASKVLNELPILTKILQNKSSSVDLRRAAVVGIIGDSNQYRTDRSMTSSLDLLKQALQDSDLEIRINVAIALDGIKQVSSQAELWDGMEVAEVIALDGIKQVSSQDAANIFIEGLKADNPLIRLNAIRGLQQMCFSSADSLLYGSSVSEENQRRCFAAKPAIKLLIDNLKSNIKPIQYAAAFALANIDPKEESAIPILREILMSEYDYLLRGHAKNSLAKIGSEYAFSTLIQSMEIENKRVIYSISFHYDDTIFRTDSVPALPKDSSLLVNALGNSNIRFLASNTLIHYTWRRERDSNKNDQSQMDSIALKLISIISNQYTYKQNPLVLKNIFNLKNQDLRRSAVYALGKIGKRFVYKSRRDIFNEPDDFYVSTMIYKKIIETLTKITNDKSDDINVRWMAAVVLQEMNVEVSYFFDLNNLSDPQKARWQFPHHSAPWLSPDARRGRITGLSFDIYSADIIYNNQTPGGAGLAEIYETLRKLLNQGSK
jgi:HEAT repeat protein